jgi:hypothetical protein
VNTRLGHVVSKRAMTKEEIAYENNATFVGRHVVNSIADGVRQ